MMLHGLIGGSGLVLPDRYYRRYPAGQDVQDTITNPSFADQSSGAMLFQFRVGGTLPGNDRATLWGIRNQATGLQIQVNVRRNTGYGDTKMRLDIMANTVGGSVHSRRSVDKEVSANTWYMGYCDSSGKVRLNADHSAPYISWNPSGYNPSYNWFDKITGSGKEFIFGPRPTLTNTYNTDLNDCYLLNRPLTDAEITDIYTQWSARMAGTGPPVDLRRSALGADIVDMWTFEEDLQSLGPGANHATASSPAGTYELLFP